MSKASDWASLHDRRPSWSPTPPGTSGVTARVGNGGHLEIEKHGEVVVFIYASDVPAFLRWAQEIFGP